MSRGLLTILVGAMLSVATPSRSQEANRETPHIPDSISEEAREFLRRPPYFTPFNPQSPQEWQETRDARERWGEAEGDKTLCNRSCSVELLKIGDVQFHKISSKLCPHKNSEKSFLYVHGGGFCCFSARSTFQVAAPLVDLTGVCAYSFDYRLAPEHPFPAAVEDCAAAYKAILSKFRPGNVGVVGESAGGTLCLALLWKARDEGLPMPAAVARITPCTDLTMSGDSFHTNNRLDPVLATADARGVLGAYASGTKRDDPLLSPLIAAFVVIRMWKFSRCGHFCANPR